MLTLRQSSPNDSADPMQIFCRAALELSANVNLLKTINAQLYRLAGGHDAGCIHFSMHETFLMNGTETGHQRIDDLPGFRCCQRPLPQNVVEILLNWLHNGIDQWNLTDFCYPYILNGNHMSMLNPRCSLQLFQ
uniref:Uncharacterized protein n=1 Tax=Paracidobacterium acidisoli TaxID=2303751 RepID=A0A372IQY8_9BACT